MADTSALVDRWAAAWATDPAELLACYADGATSWSLGPAGCVALDGDGLVAQERAGLTRVPDRAATPRSVVAGGDVVGVEWLVTGRSAEDLVPMVAPAATWWRLDGAGRIAEELRVVDWSARVILDDEQRRPLPPVEGEHHSQGWYRDFVDRLLEVVAFDPTLARRSAYADGAEDRTMCAGPPPGPGAARAATAVACSVACVGAGATIAVRVERTDEVDAGGAAGAPGDEPGAAPAGIVLLTLDGSDRVISERRYGDGWWPAPA